MKLKLRGDNILEFEASVAKTAGEIDFNALIFPAARDIKLKARKLMQGNRQVGKITGAKFRQIHLSFLMVDDHPACKIALVYDNDDAIVRETSLIKVPDEVSLQSGEIGLDDRGLWMSTGPLSRVRGELIGLVEDPYMEEYRLVVDFHGVDSELGYHVPSKTATTRASLHLHNSQGTYWTVHILGVHQWYNSSIRVLLPHEHRGHQILKWARTTLSRQ